MGDLDLIEGVRDRRAAAVHSLRPAVPTVVFDAFWHFAAQRQEVFYRRAAGYPSPWTDDPILQKYKFTNVYRATDRVSQYLIKKVIYNGEWDRRDLFFRIMLFKLFNKIETWELLAATFGQPTASAFSVEAYDKALEQAMAKGQKIYSGAYIMASAGTLYNVKRKHSAHLRVLKQMLSDDVPTKVADASSLSAIYEILLEYPTLGPFLAFQYTIDLNYGPFVNFDEDDFVVAGPGALDGISKCFVSTGGLSAEEIILWLTKRQQQEFQSRGLRFDGLWGRPMKLIDVQNVFCEIAKYSRESHPEVPGRSGRTRIKQRFTPTSEPIPYYFPPKWNLNGKVENWIPDLPVLAPSGELQLPLLDP